MRIKTILGWSLGCLFVGFVLSWVAYAIYLRELEHGHTVENAATMTVVAILSSLIGCLLGQKASKHLIKAAKSAALHPHIPKIRSPSS